jgi:hypothetical protein
VAGNDIADVGRDLPELIIGDLATPGWHPVWSSLYQSLMDLLEPPPIDPFVGLLLKRFETAGLQQVARPESGFTIKHLLTPTLPVSTRVNAREAHSWSCRLRSGLDLLRGPRSRPVVCLRCGRKKQSVSIVPS